MDPQHPGLALPAAPLQLRDVAATATGSPTGQATPSSTISPYNTGLNGVNQPNNLLFTDLLWWSLGIVGFVMLLIRIVGLAWAKLRLLTAMSLPGDKQQFWRTTQWHRMPSLKRGLIYAPLWNKRHNREIRLSSAANMGTLPSRFHALLLAGYLASNLAYMFILDWKNENKYALCAEIRGRSGTLSIVNMVPLIIFAGRNNPLISLLNVSFDTYNLLHRWMGRISVIEVIIHFIAWAVVQVADNGWAGVQHKIFHDRFISSGTIGVAAMAIILVQAFSPIRHAFYETFLNTHIILALIAFVCTWVHCVSASVKGGLPQAPWMLAIMSLWLAERVARMLRLAYSNWSTRGFTQAIVEPMPGEACRVTLHLPRFVDIKPGQHAYLRFAGVNCWENHPFSIAWYEHTHRDDDVLPLSEKAVAKNPRSATGTAVSFIIGAHTGFTRKLYNTACASAGSGRAMAMRAAFEGPYAGHHSMDSYGHCVLFAGATGITHQISFLRHLIAGYNDGTVATRRVTLVWILRDYEVLEWARPWMDKILRMPNRKEILQIRLFVTRPKAASQVVSNSTTVQMFPGRPNIPMLLAKEVGEQMGAMCVSVCGPGGLADDVRDAVRKVQAHRTVVDFVEESFTW
ncbi:ferric reductase like transmembrane component-domain-containing protein [Staphylotrichum tortipilum]|uniref:ferric-chelate reductase (NADPH) n=1 Tax=Staphylotrichum tortipilum TaxID=2831512 RepID=A0AAN6MIQ7_9PEZI|nr:ferric reductase like transmembrane component-domain-containing protein [Staphylotrichum longicolle]